MPFVSSSSKNNGIIDYVDSKSLINCLCLTISTNGKCLDTFIQNGTICVSSDVEVLLNKNLNIYHLSFISSILKLEQSKWGYGRKPKNKKLNEIKIILPIDDKGKPNWDYMENYIKSLPYSKYL